jgi:amino acid adenylation domain-containing protein/thioester reductase-like protein
VSEGEVGELYIAGPGLARGYLRRPGLTAQRFLACPFGVPGTRMYRTGDLVRTGAGGRLEFVGRSDDQVKIRGFRIEPGEVEATLLGHPLVGHAAVTVREDPRGDRTLVGYVVPRSATDDSRPEPADLREYCSTVLPAHMVPSAIVVVSGFALTSNGKIDKRSLPEPGVAPVQGSSRTPRNGQEELLCGLFASVLARPEVGIDDDFFALGGHSLLVTRLIAGIRDVLGFEVPVEAVFARPTVAELVTALTSLRADTRPRLVPGPRPDAVPLSAAQQRLWFLDRLHGPSAQYNAPLALTLSGPLDTEALRHSVADVADRHESLRTTFPVLDGQPYQRVLPQTPVVDVVECSPEDLADRLSEFGRRPFDLAADLPIRARLFAVGPEENVLLIVAHHIAVDGWSLSVLLRDLSAAYTARIGDGTPDWPDLAVQYSDYTMWHAELLGDPDDPDSALARQSEFWRKALAAVPERLELPYDRPHRAIPSHRGDVADLSLDAHLHTQLLRLAQDTGTTLFMVLQAAIAVLLHRMGAGDDIPLGTPVAGRPDVALDHLVGFFVNTLILRTDLASDPTFRELLHRVRDTDLAAFSNQDLPFDRVMADLPERSATGRPPFQVMLVLQNTMAAVASLPGARAQTELLPTGTAKFDLLFDLSERRNADGSPAGVGGSVEFATDVFDRATVVGLAARLVQALESVIADPDLPVGQVELLAAEERRVILEDWNPTAAAGHGRTLPELLQEQAADQPHAEAVVASDERLDYQQLNTKANQLARLLVRHGVGPESIVALCLPRGSELITAVWAVLKAGAAYLPLDPAYPADRISFMLADTGPALVLTTEGLAGALQEADVPRLFLDRIDATAEAGHDLDDAERTAPLAPGHPAYLIYTSGSTGTPKGVVMTQAALANLVAWHAENFPCGPGTRAAQFTAISFDVSAQEILCTLGTGGTLVVPDEQTRRDPAEFLRWLDENRVTDVFAPNLVIDALCEAAAESGARMPHLRRLAQAGEALVPSQGVKRFVQADPARRLHNHYGPTETHVVTAHELAPDPARWPASIPIGTPIRNTRVYVLDEGLRPVPPGVGGELYLAGAGLARGYHAHPALTAGRFVACPFGPPGERMYRTGDVARWTRGGELEFLGRNDDQVKIHGHRIEPGEVASVLRGHPGVANAVVLARADNPGRSRLVAYVVPEGSPDPDALRAHAADSLPQYMVPSAFVMVDRIPLTPNGKLDRRALPAPAAHTDRPELPRTRREETLCLVFAELLGLGTVDVDDDFFALGGHSLLAARLLGRVRTALGADISLQDVFTDRTPAGLARVLARAQSSVRPALCPRSPSDPSPLSAAQRRLWFLDRLTGPTALYNLPLALDLTGPLDVDALRAALADVVRRHESLRTVFGTEPDGQPRQTVLGPELARPGFEVVTGMPESALSAALDAAAALPFDLATGLPLRATLFELSADRHVLLIVLHHIAADGWSLTPLLRGLSEAYAARLLGEAPHWPPLPVQYADFAAWQRSFLGSEQDPESLVSRQIGYWSRTLDGLPQELSLPYDRPHPQTPSYQGGHFTLRLDPTLHAGLRRLAEEHRATLFMVLHAALAILVNHHGASTDIPVGTVVAGRADESLDELVGYFLNTLVLRTDLDGEPDFHRLLTRVRETDLAAFAHQDVPFDRLVERLTPLRAPGRNPLFQVMLVLQNYGAADCRLPGLDVRPAPVALDVAKFDLAFVFEEHFAAETPDGLEVCVEYAKDVFDETTARSLGERFARVLRAVRADPGRPIGEIDVLTPDERDRLLTAWNDTATTVAPGTIAEQFAQQAADTPHAVALLDDEAAVTYSELDARANALARVLVYRSVRADDIVALALPRGPKLIVAMLAVLKASAAYQPIDVAYPEERIRYLLTDSTPALIITDYDHAGRLPDVPTPRLCLDDPLTRAEVADMADSAFSAEECPHPASADNLAYVIHTSGSTGRPKGVAVTHAGVSGLVLAQRRALGSGPGTRVLQLASPSFDGAVWDVWGALLTGATLVVPPAADLVVGTRLAATVERFEVTQALVPPAALAVLDDHRMPTLRTLITGGDACPPEVFARWSRGRLMVNAYGPTETTVVATMSGALRPGEPCAPIGGPLPNLRAYVLDDRLRPTPVGVAGELYVAGAGLARGYLNRPAFTAERFVADPFGHPGRRMYRTGDLARWTVDGRLLFAGRADEQVKLRGFRVEPGEVASVLSDHPAVGQAAAVVREDRPGDKRLVAYVTPPDTPSGEVPDPRELRAFAAGRLPEYLVPAAVVVLAGIPLTHSGKLDKAALPAPDLAQATTRGPSTPEESIVCGLFADVLGVAAVGVDDDFFELGGHSLAATLLATRIHEACDAEVPVRDIFTLRTVAGIAALLDPRPAPHADRATPAGIAGLLADAMLDPAITFGSAVPSLGGAEPRHYFLTGATGFLGAFLLAEILRSDPAAEVRCLVRGDDRHHAMLRIEGAMRRYRIWDERLRPRITAIPGDLERPLLGQSPEAFATLAAGIDVIVHNGASVHLAHPYSFLRAANVHGTQEILRLAAMGRSGATPVHYVSTASVLAGADGSLPHVDEDRRPAPETLVDNGYVHSKWVAEGLVAEARRRGLRTAVYRPSRICGHSITGALGDTDAFWTIVKACFELGAAPDADPGRDLVENLVPVDFVVSAIVGRLRAAGPQGVQDVQDLVHHRSTPLRLVIARGRALGHPMTSQTWEEWTTRLAAAAETAPPASCLPAAALLIGGQTPIDDKAEIPVLSEQNSAVTGTGIVCPVVDADLIDRCLEFLGLTDSPARFTTSGSRLVRYNGVRIRRSPLPAAASNPGS